MNDDAIVLNDGEELATLDELATLGKEPESPEAKPAEPELPDKYRGKTAAEIAKMHMEAEKALGRQGAELGELRRLTDDVIKRSFVAQPSPASTSPTPEEDELDIYADPKTAVNKLVENHPKIRQLEAEREFERRQASIQKLETTHPDFEEIVQNPEFHEWVGASKVRSMLFAKAHSDFDFDAADELFTTFKAIKGTAKAPETTSKPQSTGQTLPRGRTASGDTGFESGRKIWSRAEIIRLHQTDRKRYEELQPEIMRAYAEKRVR